MQIRSVFLPIVMLLLALACEPGTVPPPVQNPPVQQAPIQQPPIQQPPAEPEGPAPTPTPTPPIPQKHVLSGAPNYCQAQVAKEQVAQINKFVADVYNHHMQGIPGFKPAIPNNGAKQPVVTFAAPGRPSFYYPKNGLRFHSTLCSAPTSPFFRCNDDDIFEEVAAHATSNVPANEYIHYYKSLISEKTYSYRGAPEEFGPEFVALPLNPVELRNQNNETISGVLHVSIVRIYTSDQNHAQTAVSRSLKKQFVDALKDEFPKLRSQVPNIKFNKVSCRN